MRLALCTFMLIFIGLHSGSANDKFDTLVVQTTIYCDHCTTCESCQGNLEPTLLYTKGVRSMSIDLEAMTITVIYNSKKISPDEIRMVISNTGFDADDIKANPEAQSNLDTCCKRKE